MIGCKKTFREEQEKVWCFNQHFLSHGVRLIMDLKTLLIEDSIICVTSVIVLNRIIGSENLSRSLFSPLPIEFAAISSYCKQDGNLDILP